MRSAYRQNKDSFGTQKFDEDTELSLIHDTANESWDWNKVVYSDIDIMKLTAPVNRFLLEDYIPYNACTLLASMPSNGKSILVRNLSMHCAYHKELYHSNQPEFVGKKLNLKSGKVLIICTEDGIYDIHDGLGKNLKFYNLKENGNINFIFHDGDWKKTLFHAENFLMLHETNLICIDTYGDLTRGNNNQDNVARAAIEPFSLMATRYQLACLFVTHLVKSSARSGRTPTMVDVLGSIGSVAKCRSVLGLSLGEGNIRYLSLLKANFVSRQLLETSMELALDEESLTFSATGCEISTEQIGSLSTNKDEFKIDRLQKLAEQIFSGEAITHKIFLMRHSKSSAQANRDWREMKECKLIVDRGNGEWKINENQE